MHVSFAVHVYKFTYLFLCCMHIVSTTFQFASRNCLFIVLHLYQSALHAYSFLLFSFFVPRALPPSPSPPHLHSLPLPLTSCDVSSHSLSLLLPSSRALRLTRQSHEKDHAFAGLIALINANPSVLYSPSSVTVPNAFFVACSSWEDPPDEPLLSQLSRILRTYKVQH